MTERGRVQLLFGLRVSEPAGEIGLSDHASELKAKEKQNNYIKNAKKRTLDGRYLTEFHIVIIVTVVIFPLVVMLRVACEFPLDLTLGEHTTEREHTRLECTQEGETGVGERDGW